MNEHFSRGVYAALFKLGMSPEETAEIHKRVINAAKKQGHPLPSQAELEGIFPPGWENKYKGSWQEAYLGSDWLKERNTEKLRAQDAAREEAAYQAARARQSASSSRRQQSTGGSSYDPWEEYARAREAGRQKAKESPHYKAWEDYKARRAKEQAEYASQKAERDRRTWEETKRRWAEQDAESARRYAARQAEYDAARQARRAAEASYSRAVSSGGGGLGGGYSYHSSGGRGLGHALGLGIPLAAGIIPLAAGIGATAYGMSQADKKKKAKRQAARR